MESYTFGVYSMGYGDTIEWLTSINIIVFGSNLAFGVIDIVKCSIQMADWGGYYAT